MPAKKREASSQDENHDAKRSRNTNGNAKDTSAKGKEVPAHAKQYHKSADEAAEYGIVQREFYWPEMHNDRAAEYISGKRTRPIEMLEKALESTKAEREQVAVKDSVVHWFKCDLRTQDNKALHLASEQAKSKGVPLICIYMVSPQDFQAHLTAPVRVDFVLRTLEVLKKDLAELDVPLHVETVEKREDVSGRIFELCEKWGTSHLFCNVEYEVDELRREARMVREGIKKGIAMDVTPDTCVVSPGELHSGSGNQYAVYSPWFRAWCKYLHDHPDHLEIYDRPSKNPDSARKKFKDIFDAKIPSAPSNKTLTDEEKKRFKSMWPAGEHEAHARLEKFLENKGTKYKDHRNYPAENATAILSVHFSSGTLSARTAVKAAQEANGDKDMDRGDRGLVGWIGEVAWRDFYKHVLAHWPHVCMNKPFKPEYTNIKWEYNQEHFAAWCKGETGFPIVDAAMRQLNHMGYMHNRCRMIVASFLAKDLLIDWRMGERYFMEHLIDGDFASNNGGWGFSASTGVDPQPYFRIFNPVLQSENYDADGVYIRKWVPELENVKGKAIHDPWGRGAADECKKKKYAEQIVEHKKCRDRALARYKEGLGRSTA